MVKILMFLVFAPLIAFAADSNSVDSLKANPPLPVRCAKASEYSCYAHSVHGSCMKEPSTGRTGICMPNDIADANGDVTCNCL